MSCGRPGIRCLASPRVLIGETLSSRSTTDKPMVTISTYFVPTSRSPSSAFICRNVSGPNVSLWNRCGIFVKKKKKRFD